MARWRSIFFLGSFLAATSLASVTACGPFVYDNAELDRFSLLEPGILNTREWDQFLAFASPAFGQTPVPGGETVQWVIHPDRLGDAAPEGETNLLYDGEPGGDALTVATNEAWWTQYFLTVRHRAVTTEELQKALYEPELPGWLAPDDAAYLALLRVESDSSDGLKAALAGARNRRLPLGLRHRYAFWAVRALALAKDPQTLKVFQEFSPGPAPDLPLARAQGWAASVVVDTEPATARDLWTDLFVRWPSLRVQTFSSLSTLDGAGWQGASSPGALVARFFLSGRDFSPETLGAVAEAEKAGGTDGAWTEAVFYAMAEQVEQESGVFALFNLVDPNEVSPTGLFTGLIDEAQALVDRRVVTPTRTWWLIASYLSLFDGDPHRAATFLDRARALPAKNGDQDHQTALLAALVAMGAQKDQDWSADLQQGVVDALAWGKSLDGPNHNRGLYHSVVVLAAQKELARGHNPQAALAFGLIQNGTMNPYRVDGDDSFWAYSWSSNNSVNLLLDALLTDDDINTWRTLLHVKGLGPLTSHLVAHSFLRDRDLTWWQAHRALRRGDGDRALALLKTLGPAPGEADGEPGSVFPDRRFSYSLDLDPLDPGSGRGLRTVSPAALASIMARVQAEARTNPTSKTLLNQGVFWLSLQLSGMPLLFSQPPTLISFTNGNFEYYGYDGRDTERTTALVATFPLTPSTQSDAWTQRLKDFYRNDFSTLGRAKAAFEAVVARHDDPASEFRALLFLQALGEYRYHDLSDHRYDAVPLAQTFRTTCGDYQARVLYGETSG
jgi:hypothetical protein